MSLIEPLQYEHPHETRNVIWMIAGPRSTAGIRLRWRKGEWWRATFAFAPRSCEMARTRGRDPVALRFGDAASRDAFVCGGRRALKRAIVGWDTLRP